MKKVLFRETDKCLLIVDIILYNLICLIGIAILYTEGIEYLNPLNYCFVIFFIVAFFSLIAYFSNRRKDDYEFLLFGLINIYVGSFSLIYSTYKQFWIILGCAMLVYTIANILNKGIHIKALDEKNSVSAVSKLSILSLLTILTLFTAINLFLHDKIESTILGYYFLAFGLISLIEPYLYIIVSNKKLSKYLCGKECIEEKIIKEVEKEKKEVKKEEKPKLKTLPKRQVKKPIKKSKK